MRDLHRRFNGDHDKVVAAYAAAERRTPPPSDAET
jgi:hypothetical protein